MKRSDQGALDLLADRLFPGTADIKVAGLCRGKTVCEMVGTISQGLDLTEAGRARTITNFEGY